MELGTIQREVFVEADPDVVFEVVSRPEHIREWWPDDAAEDSITFGDTVVGFSVVESRPPTTFSFRWTHAPGEQAQPGNSLLVTFELVPSQGGTLVKLTETGFREMGWEAAVLEHEFNEHQKGWDHFLPQLPPYAAKVLAGR
jgi:uncharacterized protein YndB with AHSA1/START domain